MPTTGIGNLILFALPLLLLLYLFGLSRSRQRQSQAFQGSISVGDDVVTTSGLFGRIVGLDDAVATLEVAPGVQVRYDRRAIGSHAPTTGQES
jgi:preprotein translocase subunit YajC